MGYSRKEKQIGGLRGGFQPSGNLHTYAPPPESLVFLTPRNSTKFYRTPGDYKA